MQKLMHMSIDALLDSFAAPAPTPGGGSASALAGALGASLLLMVAGMPKTRSGSDAERVALEGVARELRHNRDHLADLVDRDATAYDAVMRAYRLAKGTDDEKAARTAAIQSALHGAIEVPLDVMRACHAAVREGITVARMGNPSAASDAGVGLELLRAALTGAAANASVNLGTVRDAGFAAGAAAEVRHLSEAMDAAMAEARRALEAGGGT